MQLAENPKILYSLGHHTQSIGVIAMGKCGRARPSGDEQLGAAENEPERTLAQVNGRLNGWRVGRRPLERYAHTVGRAGKGAPGADQTRRSRRIRLEVSQRPPPILETSS